MSDLKALRSLTEQRLVGLDLADDPGIYPFLAGDSLELDQRCPANELKESSHTNS